MPSRGIFSTLSRQAFCSFRASAVLPSLAKAIPRAKRQKAVVIAKELSACAIFSSAERLLGVRGRFGGVDQVMVCAEVIWISLQDRLKDTNDLGRSFRRFAVRAPEVPRPEIHRALGI